MKKIKSLLSLLALSTLFFAACNNGDYDANPTSDMSGFPNPYDYDGGSIGGGGYIKAQFNGKDILFQPAKWNVVTGRIIKGDHSENGQFKSGFSLVISAFNGTGVYKEGNQLAYTEMLNDSTVSKIFMNTSAGDSVGVTVIGDNGHVMTGTFSGIISQVEPGGTTNRIIITNGFFDIPKEP